FCLANGKIIDEKIKLGRYDSFYKVDESEGGVYKEIIFKHLDTSTNDINDGGSNF
ncbi:19086_t:CDS:2, partial [Funneliformis geosporum]